MNCDRLGLTDVLECVNDLLALVLGNHKGGQQYDRWRWYEPRTAFQSLETTQTACLCRPSLLDSPNKIHGIDYVKEAFLGRVKLDSPEETVAEPEQADKSKRDQAVANPAFVHIQDFGRVEAALLKEIKKEVGQCIDRHKDRDLHWSSGFQSGPGYRVPFGDQYEQKQKQQIGRHV